MLGTYPAYLSLHASGALARRAEEAVASLGSCRACPRDCGADRLHGEAAVCRSGRHARVASYGAHHGEERCLSGWRGSGTIFFSFCNLRCVFCQNWATSQTGEGETVRPERLAAMMLDLERAGCHNLNLVTPEHVVPQILEALVVAADAGFSLPVVYNTSAYDALESLRWMDGVVDVYMPDFKVWDERRAARLLKARDYPAAARAAIAEMHRQVGDLVLDAQGLARRGVLVRHLVMPGDLAGTREIARWLARDVSRDTYVNLMDQYRPEGAVLGEPGRARYADIARRITAAEWEEALAAARNEGLHRFD